MSVITRIAQEFNDINTKIGPHTMASSVLLAGTLALANSEVTKGFGVDTYSGTSPTQQSRNIGMDLVDFTQAFNGTGIYGAEEVVNGTFDTDLTGWSTPSGYDAPTVVSGRVRCQGTDGANVNGQEQVVNLTAGTLYGFAYEVDCSEGGYDFIQIFDDTGASYVVPALVDQVSKKRTLAFTAPNTGTYRIQFHNGGSSSAFITYYDNIELKEITTQGYWLDRSTVPAVFKNDAGVAQDLSTPITFDWSDNKGVGLVHTKYRNNATNHRRYDGLRGVNKVLYTDLTNAEYSGTSELIAFTATGFTLGTESNVNGSGGSFVNYATLYTHGVARQTSAGTTQIEIYNPITGAGIIYYVGSGTTNNRVYHSAGVQLDLFKIKELNVIDSWMVVTKKGLMFGETNGALLDKDNASYTARFNNDASTAEYIELKGTGNGTGNGLNNEQIVYYNRKSEHWTCGEYDGNSTANTDIETKDVYGNPVKLRTLVQKATTTTGNFNLYDSARDNDGHIIFLNDPSAEYTAQDRIDLNNGYFTIKTTSDNVTGQRYFWYGDIDTNANGGDTYFDYPTDDTNLNLTAGGFISNDGLNADGSFNKVSESSVTTSIDFTGVADGRTWIARDLTTGSFVFTDQRPLVVQEAPIGAVNEYQFALNTGKWYDKTGSEVTNPISWLPYPYIVASETPQYEDRTVERLFTNLVEDLEVLGRLKSEQVLTAYIEVDVSSGVPDIKSSLNIDDVVWDNPNSQIGLELKNMNNSSYTYVTQITHSYGSVDTVNAQTLSKTKSSLNLLLRRDGGSGANSGSAPVEFICWILGGKN